MPTQWTYEVVVKTGIRFVHGIAELRESKRNEMGWVAEGKSTGSDCYGRLDVLSKVGHSICVFHLEDRLGRKETIGRMHQNTTAKISCAISSRQYVWRKRPDGQLTKDLCHGRSAAEDTTICDNGYRTETHILDCIELTTHRDALRSIGVQQRIQRTLPVDPKRSLRVLPDIVVNVFADIRPAVQNLVHDPDFAIAVYLHDQITRVRCPVS
jgi:hypothetical protein